MHLLPVLHQFRQNAIQSPLKVKDVVGALRELLGDLRMRRKGWGRLLPMLPAAVDAPWPRTEPPAGAHPLQPCLHHSHVLQSRHPAACRNSLAPEESQKMNIP